MNNISYTGKKEVKFNFKMGNKNTISKGIYKTGKQIRIWVDEETYNKLKKDAELFGLSLLEYVELRLKGLVKRK